MTKFNFTINPSKKIYNVLYSNCRYKVMYGGRGSGKSWAVADYLILKSIKNKIRILCAREYQNSISDSVYRLLKDRIYYFNLQSFFDITLSSIINKNGSEFIFKGLARDINAIRSMEGIDICWVEEAVDVSENSWDILIPTIRKESSEIIVTFNPEDEEDCTYKMFVKNKKLNSVICYVNYPDNKYFPDVLRLEMEDCKANDFDKYRHIWLGECTNFTGKIYKEYLRYKNELTLEPIYENNIIIGCIKDNQQIIFKNFWNYYLGLDTGRYTGASLIVVDPEENEYIIDEVYDIDGLVKDISFKINLMIKNKNIEGKVIDSASQVKREYQSHGLIFQDSNKDVLGSIIKVREKFSKKKLFVLNNCEATIEELKNREWEEKRTGIVSKPKKENDHIMNAIDYIQTTFLREKQPKIINSELREKFKNNPIFQSIKKERSYALIG